MSALLFSLVLPAWSAEPPDSPEADEAPEADEHGQHHAPHDLTAPDAPPTHEVVRTPGGQMLRHRRARRERREHQGHMHPWGQLQVFSTVWDQDENVQADPASYGDPEADPGFQLARARFGFDGRLKGRPGQKSRIDYALSVGVSTPYDALTLGTRDVGLVDSYLRYSVSTGIGPTSVGLGLAKVPFSREALMSSRDLLFMERAVGPENLTSVRDVGVTVSQGFVLGDGDEAPQIIARGGTYNGNADVLGDTDPGLMYAGRVELAKGDTYRTWNPEGGTAYGVGAAVIYNDGLTTDTVAWNADGLIRIGPWSLTGEFGRATLTPTDVTVGVPDVVAKTTRTSWVAGSTVFIGLKGKGEGVELGVRASGFDDNSRLQDNGDVLVIHSGATWRNLLPFLDVGVGYIRREELQGSSISNDTVRIITQIRPAG